MSGLADISFLTGDWTSLTVVVHFNAANRGLLFGHMQSGEETSTYWESFRFSQANGTIEMNGVSPAGLHGPYTLATVVPGESATFQGSAATLHASYAFTLSNGGRTLVVALEKVADGRSSVMNAELTKA